MRDRAACGGSNFDLLRLGAAAAVVFAHSQLVVSGSQWWAAHPSGVFHQAGDDAVAVFFVISGILVTQSWHRDPHLGRYFVKRALRLLPALAATVALSTLVLGLIVSELKPAAYLGQPATWAYLLNSTAVLQAFQLPGVFGHLPVAGAINGSLWTLRYELLCYLAVPLLLAVITVVRHRAAVLVVAAVAATVATIALVTNSDYVIVGADPVTIAGLPGAAGWSMAPLAMLMSYFLVGMCIQLWLARLRFDWRIAVLAVPLFLVCSQLRLLFPLSVVALAYPVAYFGLVARTRCRALVARGDASYGIYVWGFVIEQVVVLVLGPHLAPLLVFAIALPVTWAIGLLSWRLIERPALRFKPRRTGIVPAPSRHLAAEAA